MFELLRSWIKPIIIMTLFFFVALIILQWGASFGDRRFEANPTLAGIVNGEEISRDAFNVAYNNLRNQQFPSQSDQPTAAQIQLLRSQTWTNLVSDAAVQQEVRKLGLEISDMDIYYYLRFNPPQVMQNQAAFQTDGVFDYQKYLGVMAEPANASLWANVEAAVRPQVLVSKMQEVVISAARISREEIKSAYLEVVETGKFAICFLSATDHKDTLYTPTEIAINNYYDEYRHRFQREETRSVQVALFSKEISELDWERVREEAQEYVNQISRGSDFFEMVTLYSEGPSATDSGNLGYLAVTSLDTAYTAGALALSVGEVSAPVRSSFGWHIIKLIGIKDSDGKETTSTENAAEINTAHMLLKVIASPETLDNSEAIARRFKNKADEIGFAQAAEEYGVELKTPAPFRKSEAIQYVGADYFANEWAYISEIGDISGIYENPSNFFVMNLTEFRAGGDIPLTDIRASIENLLKNDRSKQIAHDSAQVIYQELINGADFETACNDHGAKYLTTTSISRKAPLPQPIGLDPKGSGAMFALIETGEITNPVKLDRGAAIFQLLEKDSPGLDQFEAVKDSVGGELLGRKQNGLWNAWYRSVIDRVESENYLERQIAEQRAFSDSLFN